MNSVIYICNSILCMRSITAYFFLLSIIFAACGQKDPDPQKQTKAGFSVTGYENPVPCQINFINISTNATSVEWDFGDGFHSTDFNPTHTYNTNGVFLLKLKVTGPTGIDSVCKILSLEYPPATNKTAFSYYQEKCTGTPVGFSFKSLNPASTQPVWDFGNGPIPTRDAIFSFNLPGDYTVKFSTLLGGVRDTVTRIIRIQ